jgi:PAS domain S-box-containing protein
MISAYGKIFHILVIEDNPGDVVLLHEYLESPVYHAKTDHAGSFKDACGFLESGKKYDAVLLDLTLPDLSGEKLILQIMALTSGIPVIILTGHSDMEFSIRSLSLGVSDYLLKDELTPLELWKSVIYSIERKAAIQNIEESERNYRELFENNPSPMLIWALDTGRIVASNSAAEKKYGYSKNEFRELSIGHVQLDDGITDEKSQDQNQGHISGKRTWRHRMKDGTQFFAEVTRHYLSYGGQRCSLILINDISEKMLMQERMVESALRAEEEERNRVARELHDGIVQQLVACGMFAENLQSLTEGDEKLKQEVNNLHGLIKKITNQTRDISHNLKSAEFEVMSLSELIHQLTRQLSYLGPVNFVYYDHLDEYADLNGNYKLNLYRILQELCNNIIRHSEADKAVVSIEEIQGILYIAVQDNGKGFDIENKRNRGAGLANVKTRIYRLGGNIEFSKVNGGGLQVNIEVPVLEPDT